MTDNELLLAISEMLDKKLDSELKPIKSDIHSMQNDICCMKTDMHSMKMFQENIILPRLNTIESCYTDTYNRYQNHADKMEAVFSDVELLKKVVSVHSEKLQKIVRTYPLFNSLSPKRMLAKISTIRQSDRFLARL